MVLTALPSEAQNHFYEGLAKKIWQKAGGINSDTLYLCFISQQNGNKSSSFPECQSFNLGN